jgi:hypothetical protein
LLSVLIGIGVHENTEYKEMGAMCIMQYSLESVRSGVMTDSTRELENVRGRREAKVVCHHLRELLNQWHRAAANECRDIFSNESA